LLINITPISTIKPPSWCLIIPQGTITKHHAVLVVVGLLAKSVRLRLTTDVTIRASTMMMTSSAMRIPRQFRWLGLLETNCGKSKENSQRVLRNIMEINW